MRLCVSLGMAASVALLAGCSDDSSADAAARNEAIANFSPPSVTSRADFGGVIERRFKRLDTNGDLRLEQSELPQRRAAQLLERWDTNGDGAIDSAEWGQFMLDRFDKIDANDDGSVTSEERAAERASRRGADRRGGADVSRELDEASNIS